MKPTTKAYHAGMYDAWHEASFIASYGLRSHWTAPKHTDLALAARYVEGFAKGQERFLAGLEIAGRKRRQGWEAHAPFLGTPAFEAALQSTIQAVTSDPTNDPAEEHRPEGETSTMPNTNAPPLTFRQTGPDTFMVDAGDTYIGTVQKIAPHEWWALPPNSTGTPITESTREAAAQALQAHAASV